VTATALAGRLGQPFDDSRELGRRGQRLRETGEIRNATPGTGDDTVDTTAGRRSRLDRASGAGRATGVDATWALRPTFGLAFGLAFG